MRSSWREHLAARGAIVEQGEIRGFGDPGARSREPALATSSTVLAPLTERGLLRVTGSDAEKFLQAQITNDLRDVTAARSGPGAYCTPQGRMVANFRTLRHGSDLELATVGDILPGLVERLTYFRLRAQVVFEDCTGEIVQLGLAGPGGADALARASLDAPGDLHGVTTRDGTRVVRVETEPERYEILAPAGSGPDLWDALAGEGVAAVGPAAWRLLDVRGGIPWIHAANAEAFVPQMANLHAIDGISFTKGCFPGQEIVARLRYRGTLKRRMYRLRTAGAREPAPGDAVTTAAGRAAGKVVLSAPAPDAGHELLAVLPVDVAESAEDLFLSDGAPLVRESLPYDVERSLASRAPDG